MSHEDLLPYNSTDKQPINNHLFDKFLATDTETGRYELYNVVIHVILNLNQLTGSLNKYVISSIIWFLDNFRTHSAEYNV